MLACAAALVSIAFILMTVDPVENGFGPLTLKFAPPLLLAGLALPVLALTGIENFRLFSTPISGMRSVKHLCALTVGAIAFLTYLRTLEPTASLWDCSEFIAAAYKLEVPHTPGAPLSLLIGHLFSALSFGDVSRVAWSINLMSASFSALAVILAYYIIFFLGARCGLADKQRILPVASAICGSLCLAFSDTFWFSAVEAETYGPACFFLLLLVWLILTGKNYTASKRTRRLSLIFYVAGLAYCIHPMCLLALPMLPITWSKARMTPIRVAVLSCAGLLMVFAINRFVAIGVFQGAFAFDRFFVNSLHLPFYSGAVALLMTLIVLSATIVRRFPASSSFLWPVVFLLMGFTPYLMLFIRSNHNPPIDESNPEDLATIKAYMNREGYPSVPLLYGPYFDSKITAVTNAGNVYYKGDDRYSVAGSLPEYQYDSRQTFLPRMYSNDASDIEMYRSWTGLRKNETPTFADNLGFLFRYQIGHMYLRYLMWNFAGRESDIQDSGWLRPWEARAASSFEKARNQYWMLPFALGLLGLFSQARKDRRGFAAVATLFLVNGLILVLYLNSPPGEPRERDYIYVGSYVAFSMWIGLGILFAGRLLARVRWGIGLVFVIATAIPFWMMFENFDDHDRSGRTLQVDNARNTLVSCAPNSILFTGGDNDTFPLWYLQEVEGFRTDVRVMVLSYMNTDWYINQLRKTYYDSGAFKLTLDQDDYRQYGPNDVLYIDETIKTPIDFDEYMALLKAGHPALTREASNGEVYHILPSRSLMINVANKESIQARSDSGATVFQVPGSYLGKNALAILDLFASNGLARPIYFNFTSMNSLGLDLQGHLIQEGPVYRLLAGKHGGDDVGVDTKLSWQNLIEKADYSNLSNPNVLLNYEDYHSRIVTPMRQSFNSLARTFLQRGDTAMAQKVLSEAMSRLYFDHLRPSYTNVEAAEMLLALNKPRMSEALARPAFDYYFGNVKQFAKEGRQPDRLDEYLLRRSAELLAVTGHPEFETKLASEGW